MRRDWDSISDIKLWQTDHPTIPWSMELVRTDGSIVTAANVNIPEAAVALFSTAGFGRIPPRNLAALIWKRFKDRMHTYSYAKLYEVLSNDKSKFLQGKYQELDEQRL